MLVWMQSGTVKGFFSNALCTVCCSAAALLHSVCAKTLQRLHGAPSVTSPHAFNVRLGRQDFGTSLMFQVMHI